MDSAAVHAHSSSPGDSPTLHAVVTPRALTVTAQYTLSEAGRKAALKAQADAEAGLSSRHL